MILDLFTSLEDLGGMIQVRVTPNASNNRIKVTYEPDGSRLIRVTLTTLAENGKANQALLKLLAKDLGVPKTSLSIVQGIHSRDKIIKINNP